jgi:hypothetical protein
VPPAGWAPQPQPRSGSKAGLIIGIVVGVLVLCLVAGVGVVLFARNLGRQIAEVLPTVTAEPTLDDEGDETTPPTEEPDPAPSGETFDMPIGDGVEITRSGNQWTVIITGVEWFEEPCDEIGFAEDPIVVFDVEFEVISGTASVNPLFDFTYIGDDGAEGTPSLMSSCNEPSFKDSYDRVAGDLVTGKIAFEVPGGVGGRLQYEPAFEPTASWLVPGLS